jgi:hypothetical protein
MQTGVAIAVIANARSLWQGKNLGNTATVDCGRTVPVDVQIILGSLLYNYSDTSAYFRSKSAISFLTINSTDVFVLVNFSRRRYLTGRPKS